jgi:ABC-type Na+ efflux pump permease subunit
MLSFVIRVVIVVVIIPMIAVVVIIPMIAVVVMIPMVSVIVSSQHTERHYGRLELLLKERQLQLCLRQAFLLFLMTS